MKYIQFLKTKGAIAAIFMGIFYAIAMLGIFLPGYAAIPGNVDKLSIAIVNDDGGKYGAEVAEQLKEKLPFKDIQTDLTNKQALKELKEKNLSLVVHIPTTFSNNLQKGETSSSIDFTLNEAGASSVTSTIKSVITKVNDQLSAQFSKQTAQSVLMNINVPKGQAAELSKKIETAYVGHVVTVNEMPTGMNNQNLPMFLAMAGYVGAMIGGMQLVEAYRTCSQKASKTRLFIYVQLTAVLIAVLSSLAGTGIVYLVNEPSGDLFFSIVGHQFIQYMVFFNFTAIFVFLFGEIGMMINIPILLIQTISNGAVLNRDMMFAPYEWMSHISPMYYSVQAYFAKLYGNISAAPNMWSMVAVGAVALLINIIIVSFHQSKSVDETQLQSKVAMEKIQ
ncbi:ABC transporter permease [Bacillus altitudinis]|uniref:YhgE/Pip domain-containing protein n=1 Tax=Bacillus altitudinis TaxID=293387 RepID=UPI00227E3747|nr:ABC transporter permease [Bacillus altitudinis]MCY7688859.1 ABC transporter permease [Bacillus altitudinis]WHF27329.1 ABC transporter permease [Bacillus altitudinis]